MINKIKISELKNLTFNILIQEVDLDDNFNLKHIFNLIYSNKESESFFKSYLNISYLDILKEEVFSSISNESKEDVDEPEVVFERILIRKNVYISKTNKYPGYSNEYFDLIGVSQNESDKGTYALDFMELNKISDIPIYFSKEVNFEKNGFDPQKYFEFSNLQNTEYNVTILELIKSIIWELTFHGSPATRNKRKEELNLLIEEIDLGTVKTYPIEDLFKKCKLERK